MKIIIEHMGELADMIARRAPDGRVILSVVLRHLRAALGAKP